MLLRSFSREVGVSRGVGVILQPWAGCLAHSTSPGGEARATACRRYTLAPGLSGAGDTRGKQGIGVVCLWLCSALADAFAEGQAWPATRMLYARTQYAYMRNARMAFPSLQRKNNSGVTKASIPYRVCSHESVIRHSEPAPCVGVAATIWRVAWTARARCGMVRWERYAPSDRPTIFAGRSP